MKNCREIFISNEHRFVEYLIQQAQIALDGMDVLHKFVSTSTTEAQRDDFIKQISDFAFFSCGKHQDEFYKQEKRFFDQNMPKLEGWKLITFEH